ncbi:minor capsid protein [Anaerostipes sp. Marseille-Q3525]|uniref:minor capsid protein n=1 Tax=Anaerostipes sp. Marseille-Q3525 TaxID=2758418 RepID=UPI001BAE0C33|nr:minor capsid protein [Anaerostipes sp. Marseille-Q3525]MBR9961935.1 minor capsid protein [Anaerostipes sp. Marseille-Q3525]
MSSKNYWRDREERQRKQNIKNEAEYQKKLDDIYANMLDNIEKEINGFYVKYAKESGITMAEAKKRIAKIDIESYAKKAKRYVKNKDLSKKANDEMRYYNAAMKINRLELLKANIGMHLVGGYDEIEKMFGDAFTQRTEEEMRKQAGILGKTINDNAKKARVIVGASYKNATWSERIWAHQSMLKSEIDKLLQEGLIQGKHPSVLARHLEKRFGVSESNAMRLMVTELARVQTEAQKQSFIQNGFEEYEYIACEKADACSQCRALDGKAFKVKDMMPGENAPPMHPYCHCSTAAYMDDSDYEKWLDTYSEHGLDFEEWKNSVEQEESKKKYMYKDTLAREDLINSTEYRKKFNNISDQTKVNRTAWKLSKEMIKHRSGTKYEDLAFIDSKTGKYAINKNYNVESKAKMNKPMKRLLDKSEKNSIIAIHNHPGSSVPSIPDIRVCMQRGYKKGVVVCHDGKIYIYSVDTKKYNEPIAVSGLDRLEKRGYTEEVIKRLNDAGISLEVL